MGTNLRVASARGLGHKALGALAAWSAAVVGCSAVSTNVHNDPGLDAPIGPRVWVATLDAKGQPDDSIAGKVVRAAANDWLLGHSFQLVGARRDADSVPVFRVYGDATPLSFAIFRQKRGSAPDLVSSGAAQSKNTRLPLVADEDRLRVAVQSLLEASVLRVGYQPGARLWEKGPGCWERLGVQPRIDGGRFVVAAFDAESKAQEAGLQIGDVLLTVKGVPVPTTHPPVLDNGEVVPVLAERAGQRIALAVPAVMTCVEDYPPAAAPPDVAPSSPAQPLSCLERAEAEYNACYQRARSVSGGERAAAALGGFGAGMNSGTNAALHSVERRQDRDADACKFNYSMAMQRCQLEQQSEAIRAAATLPAVPLVDAPPGGCQKDTDCKGDRICEEGRCVTPPTPASAGPSTH